MSAPVDPFAQAHRARIRRKLQQWHRAGVRLQCWRSCGGARIYHVRLPDGRICSKLAKDDALAHALQLLELATAQPFCVCGRVVSQCDGTRRGCRRAS